MNNGFCDITEHTGNVNPIRNEVMNCLRRHFEDGY